MREFMAVTNALSDPNRVRIVMALRGGELCVCQVIELLGLAPSTVSKHIALLRAAGLLDGRKAGRWMYYRLVDAGAPEASPAAAGALAWARDALAANPQVRADERRLRAICRQTPEELCKLQNGRSTCCSSAPATPAAARWPKGGPAA